MEVAYCYMSFDYTIYTKATQHDCVFLLLFFAGVFGKISLKDGEGADCNKELVNMSYGVI